MINRRLQKRNVPELATAIMMLSRPDQTGHGNILSATMPFLFSLTITDFPAAMCKIRLKKSTVLLFALLSLAAPATLRSAGAFMSFAGFGGAIHRAILEDALGPLGVKKKSLDQITRGANSQDIPFSRKLSSCPQNHSSSNMIRQGYEYWYSRLKQAVIDAEDADVNQRSRDRALFEFGEGMHTLQDFYAHSNYLEWLLQNERPLVPVDWDRMPPSIRSEFFYYGNAASNDACCSRELAVRKLCEKDPGLHFHSAERFEERKQSDSCSEALRYALEGKDLLHREVNKDHADTMQGKIVELKTGKTLYRLARELATADTALQWRHLESLIREHYPEKARRIISRLKGDKPAENTTSSPPS